MSIGTIEIPAGKIAGRLTLQIKITGMKRWRARLRLGCWLLRVAGAVIGTNVAIELR